jgi:hypothetical protein
MVKVPQIMVSPSLYDMTLGFPIDWQLEIYNVDTNGFNYMVITHAYRVIVGIYFYWLAIINEETLQIKYINKILTPELMKLSNNITSIRIQFDKAYD